MDSTTLDLFVIDPETGLPIGRPTLFVSSCLKTKMPHGYYCSFNETGNLAVSQCLLHGIMPKTYVKERYPNIKHEWECHGLFNSLKVDNALAFHGESLEDAALQLGFLIDYAPIATPWFKASIERFIGTLNRQLIHRQPGTTFSNIFQKFGYDPLKHALISKKTLDEIIHVYLIDVFPRQKHRGINDVPARLWKELIAKYPPTYPKKAEDLRVLLGQVVWRTIQRTGIEIDGLYYRSDELASLRTRLLDNKGDVKKVKVKKNLEDLSAVYVQDEFRGKYIPVPAIDQEYTKGLTQFQHEVFLSYAKKRAEDFVKIEELHDAKQYIKQLVKDEWQSRKKGLLGKNSARLLNEDSLSLEASPTKDEVDVRGKGITRNVSPRLNQEALSGMGASNLSSALASGNNDRNQSGQSAGPKQGTKNSHTSRSKDRGVKGKRSKSKTSNRAETVQRSSRSGNKSTEENGGTVGENRADWGIEYA
jgi:putative transposase